MRNPFRPIVTINHHIRFCVQIASKKSETINIELNIILNHYHYHTHEHRHNTKKNNKFII